jgi:hypothetical protein
MRPYLTNDRPWRYAGRRGPKATVTVKRPGARRGIQTAGLSGPSSR